MARRLRPLPETVPLGSVIATRSFTVKGRRGAKAELRIGTPVTWDGDAYCPVQLVGIGDERIQAVWGVDRLQALQLVFRYLDALLLQHGDRLRWEGRPPIESLQSEPWALFEGAGLSEFLSKFAALCAEQAARIGASKAEGATHRAPAARRRKG